MLKVYVDGGKKGDFLYIGVLIKGLEKDIKFSERIGIGQIHSAEARAVLKAIRILNSNAHKYNSVTVYSDLKSLVDIINKNKVRPKTYKSYPEIDELVSFFSKKQNTLTKVTSKENLAHWVVQDTYKGIFVNNIRDVKSMDKLDRAA